MCQSLLAVEALSFKTTITKHFCYLGILLSVLAEHKLTLVIIVFVLSTSPVLATLEFESCLINCDRRGVFNEPFLYSTSSIEERIKLSAVSKL